LSILPKTAIIGSIAAGFENKNSMGFKVINPPFNKLFNTSNITNLSCCVIIYTNNYETNYLLINNNSWAKAQVIEELTKANSNWLEDFYINSPSEPLNSNLLSYLLEMLNNLLILQYLISYLIIMVIIIFTCTIVANKNISLENLKSYPLGKYIYLALTKYISVWRETANFWIFFILISLLCFSLVSCYGMYQIISNLI